MVNNAEVERLRKQGQPDRHIAWMLGCEEKDLPKRKEAKKISKKPKKEAKKHVREEK